ncbi:hypothetical protein CesoFtcFv8_020776 [Champsocephalus esox]|uniref:Uncharacterized protein n=1 Tax=Champsocephalus esox TaxID=159716 RepID=A0AAN8BCD6_9TELE|nr:hypothetical protein CesoFtcFv8_020776 [Champsocephalus esox]
MLTRDVVLPPESTGTPLRARKRESTVTGYSTRLRDFLSAVVKSTWLPSYCWERARGTTPPAPLSSLHL